MWKDKDQERHPTIAVRPYNGKIFANVPQSVLKHLGAEPNSQLIFKLRGNKAVTIKVFKPKADRLVSYKPAKRRKQFPPLSAFYSQSR